MLLRPQKLTLFIMMNGLALLLAMCKNKENLRATVGPDGDDVSLQNQVLLSSQSGSMQEMWCKLVLKGSGDKVPCWEFGGSRVKKELSPGERRQFKRKPQGWTLAVGRQAKLFEDLQAACWIEDAHLENCSLK